MRDFKQKGIVYQSLQGRKQKCIMLDNVYTKHLTYLSY